MTICHLSIERMRRRAKFLSGSLCANIYISLGLHGFIMESHSTTQPQVEEVSVCLTPSVIVFINVIKKNVFKRKYSTLLRVLVMQNEAPHYQRCLQWRQGDTKITHDFMSDYVSV